MLNLYVVNRAGSFSRHAVDMPSLCEYYDLYATNVLWMFGVFAHARKQTTKAPMRHFKKTFRSQRWETSEPKVVERERQKERKFIQRHKKMKNKFSMTRRWRRWRRRRRWRQWRQRRRRQRSFRRTGWVSAVKFSFYPAVIRNFLCNRYLCLWLELFRSGNICLAE